MTQQTDSNHPQKWANQYDQEGKLTGVNVTDTVTSAVLHQYAYLYDAAGNRTSEQIDGNVTGATYNSLNQLTGRSAGGKMVFSGSTGSEPSMVTVGGNAATTSYSTNFLGLANVTSGTNTVAVVAHDVEGNTSTNNYQVVIPPASAAYTYDLNGNLMTDATRTYAWNAKNELVSIVYTSGPNAGTHTEFTYNGAGDRVKIVERSGTVIGSGTITSTKQYAGNEELDGTGTVTKRYFAQGEQRIVSGVTTNYFYTRDHLGSIREMIASDGATIDARYSYDPYGRATQVSGSLSCDFQYAGMYEHATSGLNLTQYRAYDPNVGRWLSRDPIGESGGIDLYGYVGNSPTNAIDPFGLLAYVLSLSLSAEAGIMGAGTGGSSAWGLGISFDSWNGIPYPSDFGIVNTVAKQTAYTGGGYGIGITFLGSQANNLSEMQTKCPSDAVPTLDLDFGGMHFGKDMSVSADAELGGQTIGGAGLSNVTTNVYSIAAALNWLGNAISNPLYLTHP